MEKSKMQEHGMLMQMPVHHQCPCWAMCCMPAQPHMIPHIIHYMLPQVAKKHGKKRHLWDEGFYDIFDGNYDMYEFDGNYSNYFDNYSNYYEEYEYK